MSSNLLTTCIGQRISLPGHFDVPVVLEDARPLGSDASAGYECRVRLPDGSSEIAAEDMTVASLIEEGFPEGRIERIGHLKLGFDIRAHRNR